MQKSAENNGQRSLYLNLNGYKGFFIAWDLNLILSRTEEENTGEKVPGAEALPIVCKKTL